MIGNGGERLIAGQPGRASRTIVHVDMDAFFAAIEVRENPSLAGKPVIVGADPSSRRGVVSTCSYEARRFGVRSAMPLRRAAVLCPHAVFLPVRPALYRDVSRRIFEILGTFTPLVEPVSVDEAYLDVTADRHRYPDLVALGRAIKEAIRRKERLTASVGIAPNKFLAKLATTLSKPDGLQVVAPEDVDALLLDLSVDALPGVGPRTAARLKSLGLGQVRQLRACPRSYLAQVLGQFGESLFELSRGIDTRPVEVESEARSISAETTFEQDISDQETLRRVLGELATEVGRRLRADGYWARTVVLKARYADFVTLTRRATLSKAAADDLVIHETACALLDRIPPRPGGFRLLGVAATSLSRFTQGLLWEERGPGSVALDRLIDRLNARYDRPVVRRGRVFRPDTSPSPPRRRWDSAGD